MADSYGGVGSDRKCGMRGEITFSRHQKAPVQSDKRIFKVTNFAHLPRVHLHWTFKFGRGEFHAAKRLFDRIGIGNLIVNFSPQKIFERQTDEEPIAQAIKESQKSERPSY